ncbi:MAG: LuxR family transcriptional regulator [Pseudomonadota bacterium]
MTLVGRLPSRQMLFWIFVLFVVGSSSVEIISEFADGETLDAMADDLFKFSVSAVVLGILVYEQRAHRRELRDLKTHLKTVSGRLAELDTQTQEIASQYRAVMQKQFNAWNLTTSEQDVVIGMLKGLSFQEIAGLRDTREKTVRQQASSVYRKAGVSGRHELAAWFFEDLLEPPPISSENGPAQPHVGQAS